MSSSRGSSRPRDQTHVSYVFCISRRVLYYCTIWEATIISQSLLKFMSIESVMLSNHPILCHPLCLLPSVFPSIRVFSNVSALHSRWPKYWNKDTLQNGLVSTLMLICFSFLLLIFFPSHTLFFLILSLLSAFLRSLACHGDSHHQISRLGIFALAHIDLLPVTNTTLIATRVCSLILNPCLCPEVSS